MSSIGSGWGAAFGYAAVMAVVFFVASVVGLPISPGTVFVVALFGYAQGHRDGMRKGYKEVRAYLRGGRS